MKIKRAITAAIAVFTIIVIGRFVIVAQDMKPPIAKKVPKVLKIHGYEM